MDNQIKQLQIALQTNQRQEAINLITELALIKAPVLIHEQAIVKTPILFVHISII